MPLIFSPLSEAVLDASPKRLYPATGFLMRQIGDPHDLDRRMCEIVVEVFQNDGLRLIDAAETVGGKDFLERILGLIRGTGFTVAVFSEETRSSAMANIALELGFAAMCGKPLVIVKSKAAKAPSDLTRTDWIEYDPGDPDGVRPLLTRAITNLRDLAEHEQILLEQSLEVRRMDAAVALERVIKGFLLAGTDWFVEAAIRLVGRLGGLEPLGSISDLDRVRDDAEIFMGQARAALARGRA